MIMIPASIEKRALDLMANGMEAIEAIKQAINDENNMIGSLMNSEAGKEVKQRMLGRVYYKINASK